MHSFIKLNRETKINNFFLRNRPVISQPLPLVISVVSYIKSAMEAIAAKAIKILLAPFKLARGGELFDYSPMLSPGFDEISMTFTVIFRGAPE